MPYVFNACNSCGLPMSDLAAVSTKSALISVYAGPDEALRDAIATAVAGSAFVKKQGYTIRKGSRGQQIGPRTVLWFTAELTKPRS